MQSLKWLQHILLPNGLHPWYSFPKSLHVWRLSLVFLFMSSKVATTILQHSSRNTSHASYEAVVGPPNSTYLKYTSFLPFYTVSIFFCPSSIGFVENISYITYPIISFNTSKQSQCISHFNGTIIKSLITLEMMTVLQMTSMSHIYLLRLHLSRW